VLRACLAPTCPNPATHRGRCQTHARNRERQTNRAGYKIYRSKRWRILRDCYLTHHPLCSCGEIATDVHHLVDLADGGQPYAWANLSAMCKRCHSQITRRRQATP
jgi:hypothetical protein